MVAAFMHIFESGAYAYRMSSINRIDRVVKLKGSKLVKIKTEIHEICLNRK